MAYYDSGFPCDPDVAVAPGSMVIALSGATASQVADAVQAGRSPTKLFFLMFFNGETSWIHISMVKYQVVKDGEAILMVK